MGSYAIPNNKLKGEGRILFIFTIKSLIFTFVGGLLGVPIYLVLSVVEASGASSSAIFGPKAVGLLIIAILAAIGYAIGTLKFPTNNSKLGRNIGGESLDEIVVKYIRFKKNKKIYSYAVPREEPTYYQQTLSKFDLFNLSGVQTQGGSTLPNNDSTKEEM